MTEVTRAEVRLITYLVPTPVDALALKNAMVQAEDEWYQIMTHKDHYPERPDDWATVTTDGAYIHITLNLKEAE